MYQVGNGNCNHKHTMPTNQASDVVAIQRPITFFTTALLIVWSTMRWTSYSSTSHYLVHSAMIYNIHNIIIDQSVSTNINSDHSVIRLGMLCDGYCLICCIQKLIGWNEGWCSKQYLLPWTVNCVNNSEEYWGFSARYNEILKYPIIGTTVHESISNLQ